MTIIERLFKPKKKKKKKEGNKEVPSTEQSAASSPQEQQQSNRVDGDTVDDKNDAYDSSEGDGGNTATAGVGVYDLSFDTVELVVESWAKLKKVDNWDEILGKKIFIKFFTVCPDAMVVFGVEDEDVVECVTSPKFVRHAKRVVKKTDAVIDMLGPDSSVVDALRELGLRHYSNYDVKEEYYEPVGSSIVEAVKEVLVDNDQPYTTEMERAWTDVITAIAVDMIKHTYKN